MYRRVGVVTALAIGAAATAGTVALVGDAPVAITAPAATPAAPAARPSKQAPKKKHKPKKKKKTSAHAAHTSSHAADPPEHAEPVTGSGRFETPADADALPAVRYGAMSRDACEAELTARGISFTREAAPGVERPVRLTGPLHGVTYEASVADKDKATTPYGIGDCSLVLALDDFSAILAQHDIVHVQHYSMWRPPPSSWPADHIATRHPGAVAIDVARL